MGPHVLEAVEKVKKTVQDCKTREHISAARKYIDLLEASYPEIIDVTMDL